MPSSAAAASTSEATPTAAVKELCATLQGQLGAEPVDLCVAFVGARHATQAAEVTAGLRDALRPRVLVGVTSAGAIADAQEFETPEVSAVWAARLPGVDLTPLRYAAPSTEGATEPATLTAAGLWQPPPAAADAIVVLADPFSMPVDTLIDWLDEVGDGAAIAGGLASGAGEPGEVRLLLDGAVHTDGAVAVALEGVRVDTLVSQGCAPIGQSYVVTRASHNLLEEIGGAAPLDRLSELYAAAGPAEREAMAAGVHLGVVIDEYQEAFGRGDFLIRSVLGTPRGSQALLVGDHIAVGQTVQFHVRDAVSADEDLQALLEGLPPDRAVIGGLLFTCNGRGRNLFTEPHHDAGLIHRALDGGALAGCFCAGEVGQIGGRTFLHGFTASLLVLSAR